MKAKATLDWVVVESGAAWTVLKEVICQLGRYVRCFRGRAIGRKGRASREGEDEGGSVGAHGGRCRGQKGGGRGKDERRELHVCVRW